jgi:hypothetical protein
MAAVGACDPQERATAGRRVASGGYRWRAWVDTTSPALSWEWGGVSWGQTCACPHRLLVLRPKYNGVSFQFAFGRYRTVAPVWSVFIGFFVISQTRESDPDDGCTRGPRPAYAARRRWTHSRVFEVIGSCVTRWKRCYVRSVKQGSNARDRQIICATEHVCVTGPCAKEAESWALQPD